LIQIRIKFETFPYWFSAVKLGETIYLAENMLVSGKNHVLRWAIAAARRNDQACWKEGATGRLHFVCQGVGRFMLKSAGKSAKNIFYSGTKNCGRIAFSPKRH